MRYVFKTQRIIMILVTFIVISTLSVSCAQSESLSATVEQTVPEPDLIETPEEPSPEPVPIETPDQTGPESTRIQDPDSSMGFDQEYTGYLDLYQKVPDTWENVDGGASGSMTYDPSAPAFNFEFHGKGMEIDTSYSLIYYPVTEAGSRAIRSDIPGALIAKGVSDLDGNIHLKGSVNLGMDLPFLNDANYDYQECCAEFGAYHGAKIWLVPSECYDVTNMVIQEDQWQLNRFLFEANLIAYYDTNG